MSETDAIKPAITQVVIEAAKAAVMTISEGGRDGRRSVIGTGNPAP